MKTIKLTILFLLFSSLAFSQTFKVIDNQLIWDKVINETITNDIAIDIAHNFSGELVTSIDGKVIYKIKANQFPHQNYAKTNLSTPFFVIHPFDAVLTFYIKKDRYKVEFSDFDIRFDHNKLLRYESHIVKKGNISLNKKSMEWLRHFSHYLDRNLELKDW